MKIHASEASATDIEIGLDDEIRHTGKDRIAKFDKASRIVLIAGRWIAISSALSVLLILYTIKNDTPVPDERLSLFSLLFLLALPPFITLFVLLVMKHLFNFLNWKDFDFIRKIF